MSKKIIPHCTGCENYPDTTGNDAECKGCGEKLSKFKPMIDPHQKCRICIAEYIPPDEFPCVGCFAGSKFCDGRLGGVHGK